MVVRTVKAVSDGVSTTAKYPRQSMEEPQEMHSMQRRTVSTLQPLPANGHSSHRNGHSSHR